MNELEFIIFNLGKEEYAVRICYAQEILRVPKEFISLPDTPSFIEGVINLRGTIIPVVNLNKRFKISKVEDIDNRLLILELDNTRLGIIVNDVAEVIKIDENLIKSVDTEIVKIAKNSFEGMVVIQERVIILLNALKLKSEIYKYDMEKELA